MSAEALVTRMKNYDGFFDGYPSMTEGDIALIEGALSPEYPNAIVLLAYLASVHAVTPAEYYNAKAYIADYVDNVWVANMSEGDNPIFAQ